MSAAAANGVPDPGPVRDALRRRGPVTRYATALALTALGLAVSAALTPATDIPTYAPLLGAVAIAVWYGGLGPGLLACGLGWAVGAYLLSEPRFSFELDRESVVRWSVSLLVALGITWIAWAMRRGRERAASAAGEAERTRARVEQLLGIATSLSEASTPEGVARALVQGGSSAVGANGASVGLVEGPVLRLLDAIGSARDARLEGGVVPLESRSVLAAAAREGRVCWADDHASLARDFPDTARTLPGTETLIAIPLFARGSVAGALGFAFDDPGRATTENLALAELVAEMGGSALERAFAFAGEREVRARLEQILAVAPRFRLGLDVREVAEDVCRTARQAFAADVAQVWSVRDDAVEIVWREPPHPAVTPGAMIPMSDLPVLAEQIGELRVMFRADVVAATRGEALRLVRATGVSSALRIPVVVGGRAERLLVLEWERPREEPDASVITLARRFADQSGLALEQAERLLAQQEAARRADETRRLLDLTASLASAASVDDVAAAILEQGARRLGAVAGVVVRRREHEPMLEIVRREGELEIEELAGMSTIPLDAKLPLAEAVRTNDTILELPADRGSWLAVPLAVEHRAIGGVGLVFPVGRRLSDAELAFAEAVARQGGQALERARLLEAERGARARAERIVASLTQLHALGTSLSRAQTGGDVAEVVAGHVVGVLDARTAVVYVLGADDETLEPLGSAPGTRSATGPGAVSRDERTPLTAAVEHGGPVWLHRPADWDRFPDKARATNVGTLGVVPLLVDGRPVGALEVSFAPGHELHQEQQRFIETIARQAAQPLERARLLEAERRSRVLAEEATERTRRLQRVTEGLAPAATPAEVGEVAVREGVAAVAADHGAVFVIGADGVPGLLASSGYSEQELEAWRLGAKSAATPVTDAVRSGEPVVLESGDDFEERYPAWGRAATALGHGAAICVPLVGGGRVRGALYLGSRTPRQFGEAERLIASTLARQCGQALERAELHESETAAAARVRRLQEVTAALSQASRPAAVAATCLEHAAAATGARAGIVAIRASGDGGTTVASRLGYPEDVASRLVVDAEAPIQAVLRTGQPVWALDGQANPGAAGDVAWAVVPLSGREEPVGALLLAFSEETSFRPEDREWLVALAGQCAQALERSRLYEDERATRRRAERLQALTGVLSGSLTEDKVATEFLTQVAAALEAPGAALAVADETTSHLAVLAGSFPGVEVEKGQPLPPDLSAPSTDAFRRRRTLVFASSDELAAAYPDAAAWARAQGIETAMISPLLVTGRALGVALFTWSSPRRSIRDELEFVTAVSSQCAQALDRARQYESEHTIADTLQRSVLLERLPIVEGLDLTKFYDPGTGSVDVGGDWYDVIKLESGRVGLVVGDVVGKGVEAAATMGQLRNALRAFASEQLEPAETLNRLNRLVVRLTNEPFATLAYVELDPRTGSCRYTIAGHHAPLVRAPDGATRFLEGGRSLPLGVYLNVAYQQASIELPPGATIVLYTDGLLKRPNRMPSEELEPLRAAVESAPPDPDALVEHVLELAPGRDERGDDVALLVARLAPARADGVRLTLPAESNALYTVRDELRAWLPSTGAGDFVAEQIVLAAWEACANAVEHPQAPTPADFGFEASRRDDRVSLLVRDNGRWKPETRRADRGFGLKLMRSLMETVEVDRSRRGTVVRMERRIGTAEDGS